MLPENRADLIELLQGASPTGEEIRFTPEQLEMLNSEMERWKRSEPDFFEEGVALVARSIADNDTKGLVGRLSQRYSPLQLVCIINEAAERCF